MLIGVHSRGMMHAGTEGCRALAVKRPLPLVAPGGVLDINLLSHLAQVLDLVKRDLCSACLLRQRLVALSHPGMRAGM